MVHKAYEELVKNLEEAKQKVIVGEHYYHYKSPDKFYTVLYVGLQEGNEQPCVVYQTSHPSGLIWIRDLGDWLAMVETEEGEVVPRFRLVENTD